MRAAILALMLLSSAAVFAQPLGVDRLTPALSTAAERHAADIASWATLAATVTVDTAQSWKGVCSGISHDPSHIDGRDRLHCFELQGIRTGATYGLVFAAKLLLKRDRPCAPACGGDVDDQSFFSGHTALAFSTLGGPRLAFALPLALSTGGLRVAANKHWLTDVLTGAAAGALTSRIR